MEMKTTKMTGCISCYSDENTHGMQCAKCAAVSNVMVLIHSNWDLAELEQLAKNLRVGTIFEFTKAAKERGAYITARLGLRIQGISGNAGMQSDELKNCVCREIERHHGEMTGIYSWERKHGKIGEYVRQANEAMATWFGKSPKEAP